MSNTTRTTSSTAVCKAQYMLYTLSTSATVAQVQSYLMTIFYFGLAAWRSGNGVGRINEVTLRRARLVLGWVTCPGSTPGGGTLF